MYDVGIHGMGRYVPERVVKNEEFEESLDTTDEWIRSRTGIEERRIAGDDIDSSHMALEAAKQALNNAQLDPEQLDLILVATVSPDMPFPSVSAMIQGELGAKNAAAMDLSAACAGFIYALVTAKQFIQNGTYEHVLIVGVEKLTKYVNFNDRNTAVLFGDGAGAAVVGRVSKGRGVLSFELGADGKGAQHIQKREYLEMNGREVFKFAVRQMGEAAVSVLDKAGLTKDDADFLIPHQANIRIMEAARERLSLPKEKMSITVNKYGNTSAASIPMAMFEEIEAGKIKEDDIVVLIGFGAGLVWAAAAIRWGR